MYIRSTSARDKCTDIKPVTVSQTEAKTTLKSASDSVQKKLNKFSDCLISYAPQEVKKPVNVRLEALKNS